MKFISKLLKITFGVWDFFFLFNFTLSFKNATQIRRYVEEIHFYSIFEVGLHPVTQTQADELV